MPSTLPVTTRVPSRVAAQDVSLCVWPSKGRDLPFEDPRGPREHELERGLAAPLPQRLIEVDQSLHRPPAVQLLPPLLFVERGQPPLRLAALRLRHPVLVRGEQRQRDRHDEASGQCRDGDALAAVYVLPAGGDVLRLEDRGTRLLLGSSGDQPTLRRAQVSPAQQEALVALRPVPLQRAHQQARVRAHVAQVGVDRVEEAPEGGVEIIRIAKGHPVEGSKLRRDGACVGLAVEKRY